MRCWMRNTRLRFDSPPFRALLLGFLRSVASSEVLILVRLLVLARTLYSSNLHHDTCYSQSLVLLYALIDDHYDLRLSLSSSCPQVD